MNKRQMTAQIAALLSDLTVGMFALVAENESGNLLQQRCRELRSTLNALLNYVDRWDDGNK